MNILKQFYEYVTQLKPAQTLAMEELQEAERNQLKAHSDAEYAEAMVVYNTRRITRLRKVITDGVKAQNEVHDV